MCFVWNLICNIRRAEQAPVVLLCVCALESSRAREERRNLARCVMLRYIREWLVRSVLPTRQRLDRKKMNTRKKWWSDQDEEKWNHKSFVVGRWSYISIYGFYGLNHDEIEKPTFWIFRISDGQGTCHKCLPRIGLSRVLTFPFPNVHRKYTKPKGGT